MISLPKFLWPHSGPRVLGGPGSLNRLNPAVFTPLFGPDNVSKIMRRRWPSNASALTLTLAQGMKLLLRPR